MLAVAVGIGLLLAQYGTRLAIHDGDDEARLEEERDKWYREAQEAQRRALDAEHRLMLAESRAVTAERARDEAERRAAENEIAVQNGIEAFRAVQAMKAEVGRLTNRITVLEAKLRDAGFTA